MCVCGWGGRRITWKEHNGFLWKERRWSIEWKNLISSSCHDVKEWKQTIFGDVSQWTRIDLSSISVFFLDQWAVRQGLCLGRMKFFFSLFFSSSPTTWAEGLRHQWAHYHLNIDVLIRNRNVVHQICLFSRFRRFDFALNLFTRLCMTVASSNSRLSINCHLMDSHSHSFDRKVISFISIHT